MVLIHTYVHAYRRHGTHTLTFSGDMPYASPRVRIFSWCIFLRTLFAQFTSYIAMIYVATWESCLLLQVSCYRVML